MKISNKFKRNLKSFFKIGLGLTIISVLGVIVLYTIINTTVHDVIYRNTIEITQTNKLVHVKQKDILFNTLNQALYTLIEIINEVPYEIERKVITSRFAIRYDFLENIFIAHSDGRLIEGIHRPLPPGRTRVIQERPWYAMTKLSPAGNVIITLPYLSLATDNIVIAMSVYMPDFDGVGAVASMIIPIDVILDTLGYNIIHEDGFLLLATFDGYIIAHPDPDFAPYISISETGESSIVIRNVIETVDDGENYLEIFQAGIRVSEFYSFFFGRAYVMASPLGSAPLVLAAVIPFSAIADPVTMYLNIIMTPLIILLVLLFLVTMAFVLILIVRLEKRQETEERLQLIIDSIPMAVNLCDRDTNVIHGNTALTTLFGINKTEEFHDKFADLSPEFQPDGAHSVTKFKELINLVFSEGKQRLDWMYRKIDGEPLPTELTLVPVKLRGEDCMIEFIRDLREYHTLKNKEREAIERIQLMFDGTPLFIQYWTREHLVIDCNKNIMTEYGFTSKEEYIAFMKSRRDYAIALRDGILPNTDPALLENAIFWGQQIHIAFDNGYNAFEYTDIKPDGTLLHSEMVAIRMIYNGEAVVITYGKDVSKLMLAYQALQHRENMVNTVKDIAVLLLNSDMKMFEQNLAQSLRMMANVVDVHCIHIWKNFRKEGKLGISQVFEWCLDETLYTPGLSFFYSDTVPSWEKILSSGEYINGIVRDMDREEQNHLSEHGVLAILVVPIFIKNEFWGFVGFDDLKKERVFTVEEQSVLHSASLLIANSFVLNDTIQNLYNTSDELEQASRAKSAFLAKMSHEMRTPLNAIIGMMTIGKKAKTIEEKNDTLNKISDASAHLLGVINDVLEISKIEAGKIEFIPAEFNFDIMLQKTLALNTYQINAKKLNFTVHIDKNIPHFLVGDAQRLAQVIANLMSNAIKFTPQGGKIHLEASFLGEIDGTCELQISVTDSGIGIRQEHHDKLFNTFVQVSDGYNREYHGTGLGLAISKQIVEFMNGRLWVESEIGKGSRFVFTIKAKRSDNGLHMMLSPDVNWDNIKILVAGGTPEILEQFKNLSQHISINFDMAASGAEAWRFVKEYDGYDMYFIDWNIPDMNGIELAGQIKSFDNNKQPLVIMATEANWESIKSDAQAIGVDKYLSKPCFHSTIIDCINQCLRLPGINAEEAEIYLNEFAGKKMLLAEDVEINREIIAALLENTGIEIDFAINGKEAVDMVTAAPGKYDIIFMDVQMPKMDGLEATRHIRSLSGVKYDKPPIVAVTANVFREDTETYLSVGMNDHIGKPIDIDKAIQVLRKWVKP